jgi:hypothetical protein
MAALRNLSEQPVEQFVKRLGEIGDKLAKAVRKVF